MHQDRVEIQSHEIFLYFAPYAVARTDRELKKRQNKTTTKIGER